MRGNAPDPGRIENMTTASKKGTTRAPRGWQVSVGAALLLALVGAVIFC